MIKKALIKKAVILTALISAPAAMAAAPQPTAITIAAQKPTVIYGQSTDLTGTVSPAQSAGVSIAAKTCLNPPAQVALASPLTVTSTGTGDWATSVTPQVRTFYQATAGDAQSDTAMVKAARDAREGGRAQVPHARFGREVVRGQAGALPEEERHRMANDQARE